MPFDPSKLFGWQSTNTLAVSGKLVSWFLWLFFFFFLRSDYRISFLWNDWAEKLNVKTIPFTTKRRLSLNPCLEVK